MTKERGLLFTSSEDPIIEIEYRITSKQNTSGNPMSNEALERIRQVLGNLVRTFNISTQTYVDEDDPWTGILAAAAFTIHSTTNRQMVIFWSINTNYSFSVTIESG